MSIENHIKTEFEIEDIAVSLAKICRFNGMGHGFYSVARHSIIVRSELKSSLRREDWIYALLHDSSEAFLGDMITPLKARDPEYRKIESVLEGNILESFGLDREGRKRIIKKADKALMVIESVALFDDYKSLTRTSPFQVDKRYEYQEAFRISITSEKIREYAESWRWEDDAYDFIDLFYQDVDFLERLK